MMTNLSLFTEKLQEKSNLKGFSKFSSILDKRSEEFVRKKNISKPHQFFGVWIAQNLGDFENISLYIRLAKYQDRALLEQAVSFVKDYPDAQSKHKLFLWYLKGKLRKVEVRRKKVKQRKLI